MDEKIASCLHVAHPGLFPNLFHIGLGLRPGKGAAIRYLVLVDGEHYPPVVASALEGLKASDHQVLAAVLVGGREKLPSGGGMDLGGVEVLSGHDPAAVLADALKDIRPDAVLDLSDEPVLDYRRRFLLAGVALAAGVPYEGADFRFDPPPRPPLATQPSLAIIGTGKRTGKTSVAGFAARTLTGAGRSPVIVAMGRGGPPEPEVLRGDRITLEARDLIELADRGKHAASDYVEDALLGRVPTVGCRRCGGGLAGGVATSNVAEGVALANDLGGDILIFEGSGAAIPPVAADVTGLIVPASIPVEYIEGYFGPYRLLISDFVVVTMCEEPFGSSSKISSLLSFIENASRSGGTSGSEEGIPVVRTVFRPTPTRSVDGASVFVATTAPEVAADHMKRHLESEHGCRVAKISHSLSDRDRLEQELQDLKGEVDLMLCEIKAAGVDVAARRALEAGIDVVFMDNVPQGIDGDDPVAQIENAGRLAADRFQSGV
jgi:cyclic 2,3-diphosphoglycerate synthetase